MSADVIDLVNIDNDYLYRLYCQLKEIDEYGLIRNAAKYGDSYEVLETLEFHPINVDDSAADLFDAYTKDKSLSLIKYANKLDSSPKLLLEKLLDFVFGKNEKVLPNFGRLLREFGISLNQVNAVKDLLSNSAPSNVKVVFANMDLVPLDLEIILAILFAGIDEATLKEQYEEFAFPVIQFTDENLQELLKEIEAHTQPVEEAALNERLKFDKDLIEMSSRCDDMDLKLCELDADVKKMAATVDDLVKKDLETLKSMCSNERCVIDDKTPGEIYVPPHKQRKMDCSPSSSQKDNETRFSSATGDASFFEFVHKVNRTVPLSPSMPTNVLSSLKVNDPCLAMDNGKNTWSEASVVKITQNNVVVRFQSTGFSVVVNKTCVAFMTHPTWLLPVGCRVVALFKSYTGNVQSCWIGGIVGEQPVEARNKYRYLIFFDNAEAQYVDYKNLRRVYGPSIPGYLDIGNPQVKDFVMNYVKSYPERAVVRLKKNQVVKVDCKGRWVKTKVSEVDGMMVRVNFDENHFEWLYRGNKRLQPIYLQDMNRSLNIQAGRRCRRVNRQLAAVVEFLSDDEENDDDDDDDEYHFDSGTTSYNQLGSSNKCQVARKSTVSRPSRSRKQFETNLQSPTDLDYDIVEEYLDSNAPIPEYSPHRCCFNCLTKNDDPALYKGFNPLTIPMRCDWNRLVFQRQSKAEVGRSLKKIVYSAPCGKRLCSLAEVDKYLSIVDSKLTIDLFCFDTMINPFNRCVVKKPLYSDDDMTNGNENVPIQCVNCINNEAPSKMNYQPHRYTDDLNVDLPLAHEFLSGCSCTDDCSVKSACACQMLTIRQNTEVLDYKIGYEYRCLPNGAIDTGIFECNLLCKCNARCRNKVVQNDLSRILQLFKTKDRGWGVRTLYDIPKGGFIAIYAGNVLSDMKANQVGKSQGDEYFAELDLINFCENNKEGYEEEAVMSDDDNYASSNDESNVDSEQDESGRPKRKRERLAEVKKTNSIGSNNTFDDDDVVLLANEMPTSAKSVKSKIRMSSDRSPVSNAAAVTSWRISEYIGDDKVYTLDAKVSGNIGRYLNHSCSPNVFVQNVFVDTHDLSLPWVAFFASERIKAGSELCWDYSYTVDSVPGKQLKCYCGSANCRRRLL